MKETAEFSLDLDDIKRRWNTTPGEKHNDFEVSYRCSIFPLSSI